LPGQAKIAELKGARQQWLFVRITKVVELRVKSRRVPAAVLFADFLAI